MILLYSWFTVHLEVTKNNFPVIIQEPPPGVESFQTVNLRSVRNSVLFPTGISCPPCPVLGAFRLTSYKSFFNKQYNFTPFLIT